MNKYTNGPELLKRMVDEGVEGFAGTHPHVLVGDGWYLSLFASPKDALITMRIGRRGLMDKAEIKLSPRFIWTWLKGAQWSELSRYLISQGVANVETVQEKMRVCIRSTIEHAFAQYIGESDSARA
jgi:hypothetical protein